jgi:L-aminopeptidase/D-esterase-like protein
MVMTRTSAQTGSPALLGRLNAGSLTDVPGVRVGHFTDSRRPTGCTVVMTEDDAVAGVDVRGSAPGTRETDLLQPANLVEKVNAVMLSGGSAFGLDAATGGMRYLEEHRIGVDAGVGDGRIRPDAQVAYSACEVASTDRLDERNVGAGATIGKLFCARLRHERRSRHGVHQGRRPHGRRPRRGQCGG